MRSKWFVRWNSAEQQQEPGGLRGRESQHLLDRFADEEIVADRAAHDHDAIVFSRKVGSPHDMPRGIEARQIRRRRAAAATPALELPLVHGDAALCSKVAADKLKSVRTSVWPCENVSLGEVHEDRLTLLELALCGRQGRADSKAEQRWH